MSQEGLPFGRLWLVSDATRHVYRELNDAVDAVGILPAAGACGADRADLRRALDRDGRYMRIEWALSVAAIASVEVGRRIATALVAPLGLVTEDATPLTDRKAADLAEAKLRELGGDRLVLETFGGRRRR